MVNMITGIGVDQVSQRRIGEILRRTPSFGKRLNLVERELATFRDVARDFAILEALYKALSIDGKREITKYRATHNSEGAPVIERCDALMRWTIQENIHVSVTHEGDSVIAFVLIEKP